MKTIQINIPSEIEELLKTDEKLVVRVTRHIIKERLWELKNSMEESQEKIAHFREKYTPNFDGFEKKMKKDEFSDSIEDMSVTEREGIVMIKSKVTP